VSEKLPGLGAKASITGGDPLSRAMGQYAKGHSYLTPADGQPTDVDPTLHAGANAVRGSKGGVKTHPREGGIGPGPNGSHGSPRDYQKQPDSEGM
jgi:hypothetical protein